MKYIYSFLIFLLIFNNSFANKTRIVSIKDGLSSNYIHDLKIDSKNFLWLATNNGLNRYDGAHNYIFNPNNIYGKINAIELIDTLLFVSNNDKLFKINTNDYNIDSIYLPQRHKQIVNLFKLKSNQLVAYSSNGGLLFFDKNYRIKSIIQLKVVNIVSIAEHENFLFINQPFNRDKGIVRIDLNKFNIHNSKRSDYIKYYNGVSTYKHNQLINIKNVGLILITVKGVKYYDAKNDKFSDFNKLSNEITNIFPDNDNVNNLFTIKNNFLTQVYDLKKQQFTNYLYENIDNIAISKIVSDNNNIYMTSNDGLIVINQSDIKSMHLKQSENEKLENTLIVRRSIAEYKDYKYFFNYESIYKLKKNSTSYNLINTSSIISYSVIVNNGIAYIGTEGSGLYKFDLETENLSRLLPFSVFPDSSLISYILKYDENTLLLGLNKGLYKYDIKKNKITNHIEYNNKKYSLIKQIIHTNNGQYWIASTNGIHILDKNLNYLSTINKKTSGNKICCDSINFIYQINDAEFWIGTYNGIQLYNTSNKQFSNHFNYKNGLSNNIVTGIFKDNLNRLWISTFNGLNIYDLKKKNIYQMFKYNGLKNDEYNFNSYLLSSDSNLYLGGINGYETIPINEIVLKKNKTKEIQISEIITVYTLSKEQDARQYSGGKIIYNANNSLLRIKFSTTEYFNPNSLNYYVKLDGLSDTWIDLGNVPNARLFNIPRGEYKLIFKAVDKHNPENIYLKTVDFEVKQIFYKQLWFIPGITFLTVLLILLIIYTNRKVIETRFKLKQKMRIEKELQVALNKQKELNTMRSKFITLISHEYRTPLTAIQSSVDLLQLSINRNIDNKIERQTNYLNNIKNQIQRLLEIINGVVKLNRSGDKFNDAIIEPVEMKSFIKDIIKSFNINDTQCIINLICEFENDVICNIDKETFQNAFNNILNNAVKYYYKDTEIDVIISRDKNSNCIITTRNLGIGIIPDELDKVFEVFYRGSNVGNTPDLGTGLAMAREFIRFNNGDIKIESYINEYANVIISLPIFQEEKTGEI